MSFAFQPLSCCANTINTGLLTNRHKSNNNDYGLTIYRWLPLDLKSTVW